MYDCVIVGGGAAGLAAAMVLVRARRTVLLVDRSHQSNLPARASHGVFAHDGAVPHDLYSEVREQLGHYPTYEYVQERITSIEPAGSAFSLSTENATTIHSRTVLLAQGVDYLLPDIPGLQELWGTKVWHCPYCDGYEHRDKKLLIIADSDAIAHTSMILPSWSTDLHYAIDASALKSEVAQRITSDGGKFYADVKQVINEVSGVSVLFTDGTREVFEAIVAGPDLSPVDSLADDIGCTRGEHGVVIRDEMGRTSISGVYVAGDQTDIMQQINVAVASGHKAAVGIHEDLCKVTGQDLLRMSHFA